MLKKLVLTISLLALFSTTVSQAKTIFNSPKKPILVTAKNPSFTIRLQSNPSTGFSWFLKSVNSTLIVPVTQTYMAQHKNSGMVGAPGVSVWKFKVKKSAFNVPQVTNIVFQYARPWSSAESSTTNIKVFISDAK